MQTPRWCKEGQNDLGWKVREWMALGGEKENGKKKGVGKEKR